MKHHKGPSQTCKEHRGAACQLGLRLGRGKLESFMEMTLKRVLRKMGGYFARHERVKCVGETHVGKVGRKFL